MSATDRHAKAAMLRADNDRLRDERNASIRTNAELLAELDTLRAYADKLAAGLPDGMLPRDVELLREANGKLAEEASRNHAAWRETEQQLDTALRLCRDANAIIHRVREYVNRYGQPDKDLLLTMLNEAG